MPDPITAAPATRVVYDPLSRGDKRHMTLNSVRQGVRDDFHLEMHDSADLCVLRLEGSFRESTAHESEGVVEALSGRHDCSLLVDASLLGDIDDTGLEVLVRLQDSIEVAGGKMVVYAASGSVASVLDHSPLRH
jgi:anti-anti-sigma factor